MSAADFCREMGIEFKAGRGFYEFVKPENIQHDKEIVLMRRDTGELFEGVAARTLAGLPAETARLRPTALADYRVFIQSKSPSRKLIAGYGFLYEVPT